MENHGINDYRKFSILATTECYTKDHLCHMCDVQFKVMTE